MDVEKLLDVYLDGWTLKIREPVKLISANQVIFLIHGWTGDERSMWVFAPRLPKDALLIAPRAPFVSKHPEFGGYSWVEDRGGQFSALPTFEPALSKFDDLVTKLENRYPQANFRRVGFMGFSQGSAFCYAYALRNPQRVSRLAALAGFLPAGRERHLAPLANVPVFIAHGTKDETVPVSKANEARAALEAAGVRVHYCESETGHKLGANCAKQLADFFSFG